MKIRNRIFYPAITCIALLFVSCGKKENRLFVVEETTCMDMSTKKVIQL